MQVSKSANLHHARHIHPFISLSAGWVLIFKQTAKLSNSSEEWHLSDFIRHLCRHEKSRELALFVHKTKARRLFTAFYRLWTCSAPDLLFRFHFEMASKRLWFMRIVYPNNYQIMINSTMINFDPIIYIKIVKIHATMKGIWSLETLDTKALLVDPRSKLMQSWSARRTNPLSLPTEVNNWVKTDQTRNRVLYMASQAPADYDLENAYQTLINTYCKSWIANASKRRYQLSCDIRSHGDPDDIHQISSDISRARTSSIFGWCRVT